MTTEFFVVFLLGVGLGTVLASQRPNIRAAFVDDTKRFRALRKVGGSIR